MLEGVALWRKRWLKQPTVLAAFALLCLSMLCETRIDQHDDARATSTSTHKRTPTHSGTLMVQPQELDGVAITIITSFTRQEEFYRSEMAEERKRGRERLCIDFHTHILPKDLPDFKVRR
jgi:hypothetical protein